MDKGRLSGAVTQLKQVLLTALVGAPVFVVLLAAIGLVAFSMMGWFFTFTWYLDRLAVYAVEHNLVFCLAGMTICLAFLSYQTGDWVINFVKANSKVDYDYP